MTLFCAADKEFSQCTTTARFCSKCLALQEHLFVLQRQAGEVSAASFRQRASDYAAEYCVSTELFRELSKEGSRSVP